MKDKILWFLASASFLVGCSQPQLPPCQSNKNFKSITYEGKIPVCGMESISHKGKVLYVFIEGDGHAWIRRDLPSLDPTPKNAIGWRIASDSYSHDILYLSRPCQYLSETQRTQLCSQEDWTDGRFSPKLVSIINDVISKVKRKEGYQTIIIGGYSGGGTMAMLIANMRDDVEKIITVSSPVDIEAWSKFHGVTSMKKSMNPIDFVEKISKIKQYHYVGKEDKIVPKVLVDDAISHYPHRSLVKVIEIEGNDHKMEGFRIPFSD